MQGRKGSSCADQEAGCSVGQHSVERGTLGKVSCGNAKGLTEVSPLRLRYSTIGHQTD